MWFIGGLGNPDTVHKLTRHNLGFDVADNLINYYKFEVLKKDSKKELYQGYIAVSYTHLTLPTKRIV